MTGWFKDSNLSYHGTKSQWLVDWIFYRIQIYPITGRNPNDGLIQRFKSSISRDKIPMTGWLNFYRIQIYPITGRNPNDGLIQWFKSIISRDEIPMTGWLNFSTGFKSILSRDEIPMTGWFKDSNLAYHGTKSQWLVDWIFYRIQIYPITGRNPNDRLIASCILHPASCLLHPASCILHPASCLLATAYYLRPEQLFSQLQMQTKSNKSVPLKTDLHVLLIAQSSGNQGFPWIL